MTLPAGGCGVFPFMFRIGSEIVRYITAMPVTVRDNLVEFIPLRGVEPVVCFADGTVNVSADPYATAAVANGERSVVLSSEDMGSAGDRMPEFGKTTDATIAEMNIRDFSINPNSGISADKRGKYLGVVESGTKTANGATSGLDYLKQLGVSHVQIMPMYDYGSVDEIGDLSYNAQGAQNWGYDPENYNLSLIHI